MKTIRIGIDTGGTFTDFVVIRGNSIEVFKEFSTPGKPDEAIFQGLARLELSTAGEVIHGSTVATNALLERKGARTALLTTAGFEDVVVIGRQTRRELYNIFVKRPDPLAPEELRFGIAERILHNGTIHLPLDRKQVREFAASLQRNRVESVAVCLLFAFTNNVHEEAIAEELSFLGIPISLSSRILPEYREFERTSTTLINAYLAPIMSEYLTNLDERMKSELAGSSLRVMQSNGGAVQARTAAESPVRTIVSGPAGGVVGAFQIASQSGYRNIITFDMGGTSTDVALCDGQIQVTHEAEIDGLPVGIPMIDIHTVGAGGGSVAEMDAGGALRVGPESAGSEPGPICYGRGERFTVTDANVVLGRLPVRFFLGGTVPLAADRIPPALAAMAWTRPWKSISSLAQGVIDVVNSNMEQAIRLISVERGHDPAIFALFCFGGAGGLHAADLARALGIPKVIVPLHPGALSALGLLLADARRDYSQSIRIGAESAASKMRAALTVLRRRGMLEMQSEGFTSGRIRYSDVADMRYHGQSYELSIPLSGPWANSFVDRFHETHQQRYGYSNSSKPVEVVNVRTSFVGQTRKPKLQKAQKVTVPARPLEKRDVWINGRAEKTPIFDRLNLGYSQVIRGPAIIGEYSSTTLVPPDFVCRVDSYLNLILEGE